VKALRVVLTGGGTGGHIYPLLALAATAPASCAVVFAGGTKPGDAEIVRAAGLRFVPVHSGAVLGRRVDRIALSLLRTGLGVVQGIALLRRFLPAVVVSTGGYAGYPVARAALLLGVPLVLVEPNANPGLSTRALARRASVVCAGYSQTAAGSPGAVWTGAPIRPSVLRGDAARARSAHGLLEGRFTVLVLGGSQGAASINRAAAAAAAALAGRADLQILHQTGAARAGLPPGLPGSASAWYVQTPYVREIGDAYAAADLVVTRAGALTCAEIAAVGRPSILVPLPGAAGHQEGNARQLADAGGARILPDRALTGESLAAAVRAFMDDADALSRMAKASRAIGRPDAAARVWDEIERTVAS
jgi:UDP-N-acetylglucosamine--N-acetylmuramyl-(pentapeptide) pyrophosphoryl-undecaprenol N-acetylglucosamine transferase